MSAADENVLVGEQKGTNVEAIFEIKDKIGEGAYGSVYRARVRKTGRMVALKRIPVLEEAESVRAEVACMREMKSPYIVRYYGYFQEEEEAIWVVMEWCGGGSAVDLMKVCQVHFNEEQIAVILKSVVMGLEFLHSNRRIHRDIKGGNVLINDLGECKLSDFGVAGQLADSMAKRHTVVGTPFWMAPEVILSTGYNEKADIWSLGITAIELAEGCPPLSDVHPMRAIFMIPNRPPPTLTDPSKWSEKFNDFVKVCLTKNPDERASASDLLRHPFLVEAPTTNASLLSLLVKQQTIFSSIGRETAMKKFLSMLKPPTPPTDTDASASDPNAPRYRASIASQMSGTTQSIRAVKDLDDEITAADYSSFSENSGSVVIHSAPSMAALISDNAPPPCMEQHPAPPSVESMSISEPSLETPLLHPSQPNSSRPASEWPCCSWLFEALCGTNEGQKYSKV